MNTKSKRRNHMSLPLFIMALGVLLSTGCLALADVKFEPRQVEVKRIAPAKAARLGWDPAGLAKLFDYLATLSTDTFIIVTNGKTVGVLGNPEKIFEVHSVRKAILSALVGQHLGKGPHEIPLDATLGQLGMDDYPVPLTPMQKTVTVLHLIKSTSGVNHRAAAEEGLMPDKSRSLGYGDNTPGTIWAYNNWDYNMLTTIFEERTGMSIAQAFQTGIAEPCGMQDFTEGSVRYSYAPGRSRHKAARFWMSGRDLLRFGQLYLDQGRVGGRQVIPASWIARITTDYTETGEGGLRAGHGYLWWLPSPEIGLPAGTFYASGLGRQTVMVIPKWRSVIVHQSDTSQFIRRYVQLRRQGLSGNAALKQIIFSCFRPENSGTEFCREDRFLTRREFRKLIRLIVEAHRD